MPLTSSADCAPAASASLEPIRNESGVPTPDLLDQNLCFNKIHLHIRMHSLTGPRGL